MLKCQKYPKLLLFTTKNDTKYLQRTRDELMCFIPNSSYVSFRCFYSKANQFRRMSLEVTDNDVIEREKACDEKTRAPNQLSHGNCYQMYYFYFVQCMIFIFLPFRYALFVFFLQSKIFILFMRAYFLGTYHHAFTYACGFHFRHLFTIETQPHWNTFKHHQVVFSFRFLFYAFFSHIGIATNIEIPLKCESHKQNQPLSQPETRQRILRIVLANIVCADAKHT